MGSLLKNFLLWITDLYNFCKSGQKPDLSHWFPDLNQCTDPEPLDWRGHWISLRKDPAAFSQVGIINLVSSIIQNNLGSLIGVAVQHPKLLEITSHWLWVDANSWASKMWLWCTMWVRGYSNKVIDGGLAEIGLTVGLIHYCLTPWFIYPALQCITVIHVLGN